MEIVGLSLKVASVMPRSFCPADYRDICGRVLYRTSVTMGAAGGVVSHSALRVKVALAGWMSRIPLARRRQGERS